MRAVVPILLGCAWLSPAGEPEALSLHAGLLERHLPYGLVLDPVYQNAGDPTIVSYSRCGDSALWTGVWIASESYRFAVTGEAGARENVRNALDGIRKLIDVTGGDTLARCAFPVESPYAPDLMSEEAQHGVHLGIVDGRPWYWIGDTSRDQFVGVFYGLAVAYDVTFDPVIKGSVNYLVTRLLSHLRARAWFVLNPDGSPSSTFLHRPDQQLALLKLGRRVNASDFGWHYKLQSALFASSVLAPIAIEVLEDHESYFKFHLDYLTFYILLTSGDSSWVRVNYEAAYDILRRTTDDHGNAFFDLVDHAINGPEAGRDARVRDMLEEWLSRPRLDPWYDWRPDYPACRTEDRACAPIPIIRRIPTDYLWQRSPFLLYGGGSDRIEGAGLDYLLPYWMARYYGVL